jgi:hypothetical protein
VKRLICESCSGNWVVEDADIINQNVCPYCATVLRGEPELTNFDSLDKALYGAITQKGKEILLNPGQLSGYLMDTAPALKKEIRIFTTHLHKDYINYITEAFEQDIENEDDEEDDDDDSTNDLDDIEGLGIYTGVRPALWISL